MDDMGKRALSVPEAALSHPEWREPQVRESIGAISRAAADPGAPPMSGTFVTVFLCRKEMQFNCGQRESANARNSRP